MSEPVNFRTDILLSPNTLVVDGAKTSHMPQLFTLRCEDIFAGGEPRKVWTGVTASKTMGGYAEAVGVDDRDGGIVGAIRCVPRGRGD